MAGLDELQAQVSARYARLGMPSWDDPHSDMDLPLDEEYSRVTEPERYGIVHARARVWIDVLGEMAGAETERLTPVPRAEGGHSSWFDRGVRVTSPRSGTLPLLLLERDVWLPESDGFLAGLDISVVRPNYVLEMLPSCGCDACDPGSEYLLQETDEAIGAVVDGPFVMLRGKGWHTQWSPDDARSSGIREAGGHFRMIQLCRRLADGEDVRLPHGTEAFVGHSWLE